MVLLAISLYLVLGGGFAFLRHQQLCSYQSYVANGALVSDNKDLCPNLFDIYSWDLIINNAVNPNLPGEISVAPDFAMRDLVPQVPACDDILNPLCWVSNAPQLTQTDGYTNILLVGIDQRNGQHLQNTDTIMFISYNHQNGKAMYLSFPRDLYLGYTRPNGYAVEYKINAVYSIDGIPGLNGVIEQVTKQPIHYYAYINLDLFVKLVDSIGGVDIVIPEDFYEFYPKLELPASIPCQKSTMHGYCHVEFKAGPMHLNTDWAQVYVRSRQVTTDYGRARRQQQVIQAIVSKIKNNNSSLVDKLGMYVSLYNLFRTDVQTNVELKDLAGVFNLMSKISDTHASVVIEPALDNGRILKHLGVLPDVGWSSGFYDTSYNQLRNYLNKVSSNISFYTENPKIKIYVNPAATNLPDIAAAIDGGMDFVSVDNDDPWPTNLEKLTGIRIYDFSNGEKAESVKDLQSRLPGSRIYSPAIDGVIRTEWGEEMVVVIGKLD